MADEADRRRERLIALTGGLLASTFVVSFLTQPLMRFVDPEALSIATPFLVVGILITYYRFVFGTGVKRIDLIEVLCLASGIFLLVIAWVDAQRISNATDAACGRLEVDMLSAQPARTNSAEVFDALQCRPQRGSLTAKSQRALSTAL